MGIYCLMGSSASVTAASRKVWEERERERWARLGRKEGERVRERQSCGPGLNRVLTEMLASGVPVESECVTVETTLVYFSCQPEREALLTF